MNVLIIGGNSGLGRELADQLSQEGATVYITGTKNKKVPSQLVFIKLNITDNFELLRKDLNEIITQLPFIDLIIYSAGFREKGHISELSDAHIAKMIYVGLMAPALMLQRILQKQRSLSGLMVITSTSQWIPRELEPVYTSTKAGLAMLAQSISFDPRVKKTLVVGPTGLQTDFWINSGRDVNELLQPDIVATQILSLWNDNYVYRLVRILRDPVPESERIQIIETRFN